VALDDPALVVNLLERVEDLVMTKLDAKNDHRGEGTEAGADILADWLERLEVRLRRAARGADERRHSRQRHALLVHQHGVSSARLYWENKLAFFAPKNVQIPTAISVFPDEIYAAPRSWTERAYPKLIHYNKLDKGGHFAAWEQPELFSVQKRFAPASGPSGNSGRQP
jgi:hypothetical protein